MFQRGELMELGCAIVGGGRGVWLRFAGFVELAGVS